MPWKRVFCISLIAVLVALHARHAYAGDITITIPKRSQLTPVQRLNREGVEAVRKHQLDKAKTLFYKAYLYDPGDPFTLNNIAYVSELEGQVERAQTFYSLASSQATDAIIDKATSAQLRGETLQNAINGIHDVAVQINHANVEAVRLLSQGRAPAADLLLQQTLALDPHNGFTLNNMGVAKEAEGEYEQALKYYTAAAGSHSDETVIVTVNPAWRGKPVSQMASESVKKLRHRMETSQIPEARAALFSLRGVSAINRNDWQAARQNFLQAYKLDPTNAFVLNNLGYLTEADGDLETAQEFYREAQRAAGANAHVGLATRQTAEGMRLAAVADQSEGQVSNSIQVANEVRRRKGGPIQLKRRDNTPVVEQSSPPPSTPPQQP